MSEWQPIETAPKDECRVLLFGPDGMDIGRYVDWTGAPGWERTQTAEYDNSYACISSPTHWMPLPLAPDVMDEGGSA